LEQLLVTQKLSRELEQYKVPSPAARAVAQLQAVGKEVKVGQYVRFLYTIGEPGVYAWDLPQRPEPNGVDLDRYVELLLRAAHTVLQPLGVKEETLRWWLYSNAGYGGPPGEVRDEVGLPLFTSQGISRA
jgi:DNA polymerase elongation subunit (family B)